MHPFRTAVEARDHDAMVATLADGVILHSPVAHTPFEGKPVVARLLRVLMEEVFEDFVYTDELASDEGVHALIFRARIGDRAVEGLDLVRHDAAGRIDDFTVMVRPASGLQALGEAVAPHYPAIIGG